MKIYLAGQICGKDGCNQEAFDQAALQLRAEGHMVFSPIEFCRALYGSNVYNDEIDEATKEPKKVDLKTVFAADLNYICMEADAIALLPGWEYSEGARAEHAVARKMKLKFIYL